MRILFTSTAGLGHFYPLLPMMRAARAAGDEVLVALPPEGTASAEAQGFRSLPTASPPPAALGEFWAGLPRAAEPNTYVLTGLFGRLNARAALPETGRIMDEFAPDLVISEVAEFSGQVAAARRGIPHVTVGIGSMGLPDLTHAVLAEEVDRFRVDAGLDALGAVPWKGADTRFVTGVPEVLWRSRDDVPADTLVYRHEDPEGTAPTPAHRATGRRPSIYASLGSVAGRMPFAARAFPEVLAGLAVVDADILFTVGSADRSALGPVPPHIHIESYVAQDVAMSCDAVVSHMGSGSTAAALSRGLPMVSVPLFADQMHNAERVATAGAGLTVDARSVRSDLPAAVDKVLTDPGFAENARSIAADIASLPSAAEVLARVRRDGLH
jgi:UDP:flavonoid glycosyltransferase YjiC (YdhE family)